MENLKLCEVHYLQGRHRQFKEKVPESLKLQRKRKKKDSNVEIRARKVCKMANMVKKRRKVSEGSEALVAPKKKGLKLKQVGGDVLELIRMLLKKEVEKRKKKNKKKTNEDYNEEEEDDDEEDELDYNAEELRRELPNGVMAISPASTPHDYSNVGSQSHCDVKVGVDYKAVTPRYFRSKNVERLPVGKLQVSFSFLWV